MKSAKIVGLGKYLPSKILTNSDLEEIVDTSDEWITTRTGIKERRIAKKGEGASFLAYQASIIALKRAGIKPKDLDLIIACFAIVNNLILITRNLKHFKNTNAKIESW